MQRSVNISIPIKKIFEEIAYCLAIKLASLRDNTNDWDARICGILSLVKGTLYPIGTPLVLYHGCYFPEDIIEELETNNYWSLWSPLYKQHKSFQLDYNLP